MDFLGSNIQLTKPYIKGDDVLPPLHAADEREKLPFGPQIAKSTIMLTFRIVIPVSLKHHLFKSAMSRHTSHTKLHISHSTPKSIIFVKKRYKTPNKTV